MHTGPLQVNFRRERKTEKRAKKHDASSLLLQPCESPLGSTSGTKEHLNKNHEASVDIKATGLFLKHLLCCTALEEVPQA